ncbi:nucleotidyl transferase AbiEii/AbiGii toxin family protein [Geotoga petraea]|uniref:Nucleotidyl transferase AbiEii toxin, Type IV TA system n=1 Tax=Geotoga petraea TaxID=28234 RepID=A0A1G6MPP3_9BACT|nr:nucleotidyl transferase AbiEii/AbiGii toxin family protein [Geotoga petraea]SDC56956.1 Nucleotidyl transferase AbiEii toxin, Type IV TA system [Geotoga petraea]
MALTLLESLSKVKLDFIFKGGTSLTLLIDKLYRFSIDVDIILENQSDKLDNFFNNLINDSSFIKYEEQIRRNNHNIPKSHYKFFYNSFYDNSEKYILLDILYEKNNYSNIIKKDINCEFISTEEPYLEVDIPCVEDILGDKLTAFAPSTTGILYDTNKNLEIIKQMFDIGILFDYAKDLTSVKKTFEKIAAKEIEYRKLNINSIDVLNDIFETSITLCHNGYLNRESFLKLKNGIKRFNSYVIDGSFNLNSSYTYAAKAAYISILLKNNNLEIKKFKKGENLNDKFIENTK